MFCGKSRVARYSVEFDREGGGTQSLCGPADLRQDADVGMHSKNNVAPQATLFKGFFVSVRTS